MSERRRPAPDEFHPFYAGYVGLVGERDPVALLGSQVDALDRLLAGVDDEAALARYAPGKWSIKEVLVHLSDAERVLSTRALRIARGDATPLPGWDENVAAAGSAADRRTLAEIREELGAVRAATLALFRSLDAKALDRRGTANDAEVTARALLWIVAGHVEHHMAVLRERYGVGGAGGAEPQADGAATIP